jgi:hypothetical protein
MATKAEQHRADQQVANWAPRAKKAPPRRGPVDAVRNGHNQGSELKGTALRNLKTAPTHQKGGPALEDSESGTPSRKSTRGSSGRVKQATNLQRREIRRTHSSKARALGARRR